MMQIIAPLSDSDTETIELDNIISKTEPQIEIEKIYERPGTDAELDASIIVNEDETYFLEIHEIRTADNTELYDLIDIIESEESDAPNPFIPCSLEDLVRDIVNSACTNIKTMADVAKALNGHFSRSKAYTDKRKNEIKLDIIGRIKAKQIPEDRYNSVLEIVNSIF